MKTIKELENLEGTPEEMKQVIAYKKALEDVLKLIDEWWEGKNRENSILSEEGLEELKVRIQG